MNERPRLESGKGGLNGALWVTRDTASEYHGLYLPDLRSAYDAEGSGEAIGRG